MIDSFEMPAFTHQFVDWPVVQAPANLMKRSSLSNFVTEQKSSDKLSQAVKKETLKLFDDGRGKRQVWLVSGKSRTVVPEKAYGQFYSGGCYIVQYVYKDTNVKENYVVYYWTGSQAAEADVAAAPVLAAELDASLSATLPGVLSHVVQGREPDHFLALFNGKVLVHQGKPDGSQAVGTRLYHVFGTSAFNTRAFQVKAAATSLNSYDTFVLASPEVTWAWMGKNSVGDERSAASAAAETLSGNGKFETIFESNETPAFWDVLGGKADYVNTPPDFTPDPAPRLYYLVGTDDEVRGRGRGRGRGPRWREHWRAAR